MDKSAYRSYILTRFKLGNTATVIWDELKTAHGEAAPSRRTVFTWVERFKSGDESIEDNMRPGAPITATIPENIETVRSLIEVNPNTSYAQIEAATSYSHATINRIIHDHLHLRKLSSRWVPYDLTDAQKALRVLFCQENLAKFNEGKWRICDIITGDESWIYHRQIGHKQSNATWVAAGGKPRTVVRRNQFEPKSMITVFFKSTGPVLIDVLDKGKTIDHKYYIKNVLKPAIQQVREQRPESGTKSFKILHHNAKVHVAKKVKSYLEQEGMTTIRHPPYSPDLAPCDVWLFDKIKQNLTDHVDAKSLENQITEILMTIPKEEYRKTFEKYLERMKLCVDNKGEYFVHLIK